MRVLLLKGQQIHPEKGVTSVEPGGRNKKDLE